MTDTTTETQPNYQEAADLGAILASVHPRTYTPTGDMAQRITRRLAASFADDASSEAIHLLSLLKFSPEVEAPIINFWADELTAPHAALTERHRNGGATVWRIRLAAAGAVYVAGNYRYWPDSHLDADIPNMPVTLGVDDWCLNF